MGAANQHDRSPGSRSPGPARRVPVRLGPGWRDRAWERLTASPFDVLVIGGGITGTGIARRAAQAGLRTALVEKGDLAGGTSAWSSKLVHGGLRYLAHLQVGVVRESVRGREALLQAAPGLVEELGFLMPVARGTSPGRVMMEGGLTAYDMLARRRTHRRLRGGELGLLAPRVRDTDLTASFRYGDAWTDDARLVFRVAQDAVAAGAVVLSYAEVQELLLDEGGAVLGVRATDSAPGGGGRTAEIRATAVVNATGAWADRLRARVGGATRLRPLRGSHLLFPAWRLPVAQAVSFAHPEDGRPVFAYPWESVTLVGTTDVDHPDDLDAGARISAAEATYLLAWARHVFPALDLQASDVHATFAGVRPVIGSGKADPSAESRDHACWEEGGLLTVTGGKLTTFDAVARDALSALRPRFSGRTLEAAAFDPGAPPLDPLPAAAGLPEAFTLLAPGLRRRLAGRHGADASALVEAAADRYELATIPGAPDPWAALRWAARAEGVVHLDDLLLRRVRLGLLLPDGGAGHLPRIRSLVAPELDWDDARWEAEESAYRERWERDHAPKPAAATASRRGRSDRVEPGRGDRRGRRVSADQLLAVDVGTQSVRALLFDPVGTLLARAKVPIEPYVAPHPGWAENDPELYWGAVGEACRTLVADPAVHVDAIAGLALTTQRGTVVVVDADGRPLRPAMVWLDQRRTKGLPRIGGASGVAFRLLGVAGTVASFQAEAEANWLIANEPATWARTAKYLLLSGFLVQRLVGRYVDADAAQVGYLPFDFKRRRWANASDWKWKAVAVEREMLPRARAHGRSAGGADRRSGRPPRPPGRARGDRRGRGQGLRGPGLGRARPACRRPVVRDDGHHQHHAPALRGIDPARAAVSGRGPGRVQPGDPGVPRLLAGRVVPPGVRRRRRGRGARPRDRADRRPRRAPGTDPSRRDGPHPAADLLAGRPDPGPGGEGRRHWVR